MEPNIGNAPLEPKEIKGLDSPVHLHFHSRRKRLIDSDGASAKAVIDGFVHAGLFATDTPVHIKEVSYSQEKIKKGEEEETIVYVYVKGEE